MSLNKQEQTTVNKKRQHYRKCSECKRKRKFFDKSHEICRVCHNVMAMFKSSGNKVIDDFIKHTQTNYVKKGGKIEFVPYEQFKDIEFIAEGGFSKIYKATWVDGPIWNWDNIGKDTYNNVNRNKNHTVVLKKLNNSKNITSKELNELKVFYQICLAGKYSTDYISEYYGITQEPNTKDLMIIMPYYNNGDLIHYLCNDFYNLCWYTKLSQLLDIAFGLQSIHDANVIHRDLHSGNIFFGGIYGVCIGDLGISKSATESADNNEEKYGIVPYMAPEIFQGQKYTKASDIYSFGMIMWEFMTGRRPFWDEIHDIDLIIKICDGLRPPIVTNAPDGYIDLMKDCWNSDPEKRPTANDIWCKIWKMYNDEFDRNTCGTMTKIIKSPDIGPVTINNPGAIFKSRPLSKMIRSAMSLRSSRRQSINLEIDPFYYYQKNNVSTDKRKFEDDKINDQNIKRRKLFEKENNDNDYVTKEIQLDINTNTNSQLNNNNTNGNSEYTTREIDLDINSL